LRHTSHATGRLSESYFLLLLPSINPMRKAKSLTSTTSISVSLGAPSTAVTNWPLDDDDDAISEDGRSDYSESSNDTIDANPAFFDVAKRVSRVKSTVSPENVLKKPLYWQRKGENLYSHLLKIAVREGDLEGFKQIADLYGLYGPDGIDMGLQLLEDIIWEDQPDILDEYIRRTGYGLQFAGSTTGKESEDEEEPLITNDKNRLYLGLNVHGQKRRDLARMHDPDHKPEESMTFPLVWKAVVGNKKKIIEYLASNRPLHAVKHFLKHNSSDKAERLRQMNNLDQAQVAKILGWAVSPYGESPISVSAMADDKNTFQRMVELSEKFGILERSLHRHVVSVVISHLVAN
jgi:hypothetical protein